MIAALLGIAVAGAWLAALGLLRFPLGAERLHLVSMASLLCLAPILVAAGIADGATPRLFKIAAILLIELAGGAAGAHALGRALRQRGDRM